MNNALWKKIARYLHYGRKYAVRIMVHTRRKLRKRHTHVTNALPIITIESQKNVSVAAKTAFIEALAAGLKKRGIIAHVWSKGRNTRQTRLVLGSSRTGVSDEAFILSHSISTWVSNSPEHAMNASAHDGANILLLNGKNESPALSAIFSIGIVENATTAQDLDALLAGPGFHKLSRMDAIVFIGSQEFMHQRVSLLHRPIYHLQWSLNSAMDTTQPVIGFTGISDMGALYKMLMEGGYNVKGFVPLPLIKRYTEKQINNILHLAETEKAVIATSQRDMLFLPKKNRRQVQALDLSLQMNEALIDEIARVFNAYYAPDEDEEVLPRTDIA